MKFQIEQCDDCDEVEICIRCGPVIDSRLEKIIAQIRQYASPLTAKKDGAVYPIAAGEVLYFESLEDKTFVYRREDVMECTKKLYELEEMLGSSSFVRISKSILLNIDALHHVRTLLNGRLEATLINGERVMINRHYVPEFKEKIGI